MSKSKGNVIDPLTKMRQYGTDALRMTLASMASPGRDIKLAEERIEGNRNFVTKLWNAARFIQLYADGPQTSLAPQSRPFPDKWILSRLNHTIREVTKAFEDYRFDQAASTLYQFIWHEYCDWFIELAKPCLQQENHPDAPAPARRSWNHLKSSNGCYTPCCHLLLKKYGNPSPTKGCQL